MVAIVEKKLRLNRNIYEMMRTLGSSFLAKDSIKELLPQQEEPGLEQKVQLEFYFKNVITYFIDTSDDVSLLCSVLYNIIFIRI